MNVNIPANIQAMAESMTVKFPDAWVGIIKDRSLPARWFVGCASTDGKLQDIRLNHGANCTMWSHPPVIELEH